MIYTWQHALVHAFLIFICVCSLVYGSTSVSIICILQLVQQCRQSNDENVFMITSTCNYSLPTRKANLHNGKRCVLFSQTYLFSVPIGTYEIAGLKEKVCKLEHPQNRLENSDHQNDLVNCFKLTQIAVGGATVYASAVPCPLFLARNLIITCILRQIPHSVSQTFITMVALHHKVFLTTTLM